MTDVRQPLVPGALRALVAKLADPSVACVSGNLVLRGSAGAGAYWRYENWIRMQESRFRGMVGVTGPIYAIRKADMRRPARGRDPRRYVGASAAPARRATHPVCRGRDCLRRRLRRQARVRPQGAHPRRELPALRAAPGAAGAVQEPVWFETFSHKLLRLVCPWALLGLLAASGLERSPRPSLADRALWAEAAARGADGVLPVRAAREWAGRIGSLCRTFVVLNSAAVVGLWRFVTGGAEGHLVSLRRRGRAARGSDRARDSSCRAREGRGEKRDPQW